MSDSDDEAHNCNVCGTPVRYGSRHSECGASVMRVEKAALRPRNPEMDAIVKGIHGSPAFTLENAAKAVSAAMAKHAHTRRCEACDGSGRIDSSYTVHVPEHGRGAGEVLTTENCDACEGEGRIAVPDDEDDPD